MEKKTCSEPLLDKPADDVVLPASATEDHMPLAHGVGPHARRLARPRREKRPREVLRERLEPRKLMP